MGGIACSLDNGIHVLWEKHNLGLHLWIDGNFRINFNLMSDKGIELIDSGKYSVLNIYFDNIRFKTVIYYSLKKGVRNEDIP